MIVHPNWPCSYSNQEDKSFTSLNTDDEIQIKDDTDLIPIGDIDQLLNFLFNPHVYLTELKEFNPHVYLAELKEKDFNKVIKEKDLTKLNKKIAEFSSKEKKHIINSLDEYINNYMSELYP